MDQLIKVLIVISISTFINYLFSKYNILIDDVKNSVHKSNMNSMKKIPLSGGIIFLIQKNLTIIMAPVIVHCAVQDWKCNFWSCFAKL